MIKEEIEEVEEENGETDAEKISQVGQDTKCDLLY
jgi:hypothetical protein